MQSVHDESSDKISDLLVESENEQASVQSGTDRTGADPNITEKKEVGNKIWL